jgi:chromosome segregation ATPase
LSCGRPRRRRPYRSCQVKRHRRGKVLRKELQTADRNLEQRVASVDQVGQELSGLQLQLQGKVEELRGAQTDQQQAFHGLSDSVCGLKVTVQSLLAALARHAEQGLKLGEKLSDLHTEVGLRNTSSLESLDQVRQQLGTQCQQTKELLGLQVLGTRQEQESRILAAFRDEAGPSREVSRNTHKPCTRRWSNMLWQQGRTGVRSLSSARP